MIGSVLENCGSGLINRGEFGRTSAPEDLRYYLGFLDQEYGRVECAENPFGAKVVPMSPQ